VILYLVVGLLLGVIAGALVGTRMARKSGADAAALANAQAQKLLQAAQSEADTLKQEAELQGREHAFKLRAEADEEVRTRKAEEIGRASCRERV